MNVILLALVVIVSFELSEKCHKNNIEKLLKKT